MVNSHLKPRVVKELLPIPDEKKTILITGARQTGKSTLVKNCYPHLNYFNLDAFEIRQQIQQISSFDWARTVGKAIIDEAQKEPSVFEKTKFAFDAGELPFTVLLGSSQILMLKKIRESLAGRVKIFELFPLMPCELIASEGQAIAQPLLNALLDGTPIDFTLNTLPSVLLGEKSSMLKNAENYLLNWGGMPSLINLNDHDRRTWLADYEYTYLQRDLGDLAKISDLGPFQKLQRLAALRSGKLLSFSELSRDIGISVDTVRRYIEYLKLSYQAVLLQPYYSNRITSTIKTPKLYWIDCGILRHLSGYWGDISGDLFETYIVSEIHKWIKSQRRQIELFFYRTQSGVEVDLILQIQQKQIGLEIKCRDHIYKQDIKSLIKLAHALGENWLGGILIYRGETIEKIAEPNIWAVPSWRLLC